MVINTPYIYYDQDELHSNSNEKHLSGWDIQDFKDLGAKYIWRDGISLIVVFSNRDLNIPLAEDKVDELNNQDIINLKLMLNMYLETNQFKESYRISKKYTEIYPNDFEINLICAFSSEKIGYFKEAYKHAKLAYEMNSESQYAKKIMERNHF
ncbi:protein of unknown function [Tepidibacter aestuarii]|nr:protein of unknown function [Tepidibacter aestuarii]